MRIAGLGLLMPAASWSAAAHAACEAIGATYAPRSTVPSPGIRYRMALVPTPPGVTIIAERHRFGLLGAVAAGA